MSTWAKYLIGLALALPMSAYVAGSLMASAVDDPGNRDPVRISDHRTPGSGREDDAEGDDDVDDNGVRVVSPQPTRLGDGGDGDDGDADDDGDDDDDRESTDDSRDGTGDDDD